MLKLVQWAFKLGQQTERQRIASILSEHRRGLPFAEYGTGNDKDTRSEAEKAADRQISHIIGYIVDPQYNPERAEYSVLYPRESKRG